MRTLVHCLLVTLLAFAASAQAQAPHTIWLVRHAEKALDGGQDPGLTAAGEARAANLADWLESKRIGAIWSTDTVRTRATAQPLADALGLELRIYDPDNAIALAGRLKAEAVNALVVGHSNTIPALVEKLSHHEIEPITEDDYDRLYSITMVFGHGALIISNQSELFGGAQNQSR